MKEICWEEGTIFKGEGLKKDGSKMRMWLKLVEDENWAEGHSSNRLRWKQ